MKKRDSAPAGWYYDFSWRFAQRFWDGKTWTDRVASGTTESTDPLGIKGMNAHQSPSGASSETPARLDALEAATKRLDSIAKPQPETPLGIIFRRSAYITGSLSLLLSLTSGRIGGESYGDGNFENTAFGIDLVLYTVFNGVVFGGLIVGVVALVRKRRKGKG